MSKLKTKHKIIATVEAELLKRVRASNGLSRVELARELHLAPSTAGIYVDRLIKEGFLFESCKAERDFGRPPTLLALNPEGGRFVGVDFEARNLMATCVDFSQQPLKNVHLTLRPTDSVEQILTKIEQAVEEAIAGDTRKVLGIGVGVPGLIDAERGVAVRCAHIKGWENVPLGDRLSEKFKAPVHLENNIRSMALAELWFGAGRGEANFICVGIRTGIAAGIISGGRLQYGTDQQAGEIGAWPCTWAPRSKEPLADGELIPSCRVLEEIVSLPAILTAVAEGMRNGDKTTLTRAPVQFDEVVAAAQQGDPLVERVMDEVSQALALVAGQISLLFNPKKIILAGPLTGMGEAYLTKLNERAQRMSPGFYESVPTIVSSTLGRFNGALGAAALALHEWKPAR